MYQNVSTNRVINRTVRVMCQYVNQFFVSFWVLSKQRFILLMDWRCVLCLKEYYTLYFANQRQHITDMKTILQTLT